ncbi:hypothetical protein CEXT_292771 [Caerostris extrusa]|uniref:Maturase K n=1 Tax=Caerostris extrusa TaxID=172846 RepID=A0AAV4YEA7_CAEEX|nr:hypothetical protein CEXT_292771 [Caerostris extrusa]
MDLGDEDENSLDHTGIFVLNCGSIMWAVFSLSRYGDAINASYITFPENSQLPHFEAVKLDSLQKCSGCLHILRAVFSRSRYGDAINASYITFPENSQLPILKPSGWIHRKVLWLFAHINQYSLFTRYWRRVLSGKKKGDQSALIEFREKFPVSFSEKELLRLSRMLTSVPCLHLHDFSVGSLNETGIV